MLNHVPVVVGFKNWMDVITSSAPLARSVAEKNGAGGVVPNMNLSGKREIVHIKPIALILLD
jgi:hypothetical protein